MSDIFALTPTNPPASCYHSDYLTNGTYKERRQEPDLFILSASVHLIMRFISFTFIVLSYLTLKQKSTTVIGKDGV